MNLTRQLFYGLIFAVVGWVVADAVVTKLIGYSASTWGIP